MKWEIAARPEKLHSFWHAPLVPVAAAGTCGIVFDRYTELGWPTYLILMAVTSLGWLIAFRQQQLRQREYRRREYRWPLLCLLLFMFGLGAFYHNRFEHRFASNDIGNLAQVEPRGAWVRGFVDSEPEIVPERDDPLQSWQGKGFVRFDLRVTEMRQGLDWQPLSGRVRVTLPETEQDVKLHAGDHVEIVGKLSKPETPANPGTFDFGRRLRDGGVTALLIAPASPDSLRILDHSWPVSLFGWLGAVRGWCHGVLQRYLPLRQYRIAAALLLGDGSAMSGADWEKYHCTGVLHVLAISGQHLVVLAWLLGVLLQTTGMRRRVRGLGLVVLLLGYALLTGGRPPVMRAAWGVTAYCVGVLLRRTVLPANVLALAWIVIVGVNPTQVFDTGCQLSFLAVFVLVWGPHFFLLTDRPEIQQLVDDNDPWTWTLLRRFFRGLAQLYLLNLVVWLALAPLIAARYHLISPISLIIGPPMIILSSLALVCGFLLLVSAAVMPPLAALFALPTRTALGLCETITDLAMIPGWGHEYVADIPTWLLIVFYAGLVFALTTPAGRRHWKWMLTALACWLAVAGIQQLRGNTSAMFRCTFLAVGHGGCTVIETPAGKTLLYDAGALGGPDVTRIHIAPFLWQRGIRHIDQVVLSHADLDHFNGLPALLNRFGVGQILSTPTFSLRTTPAARIALEDMQRRGLEIQTVHAGERWSLDGVEFEVLHPPESGPEGNENTRSLVVSVVYEPLSILLTGDLEGAGLERVLEVYPPRTLDVLMAPHHGSKRSNTPEFARWARTKVVVSCQRRPAWESPVDRIYREQGAVFLGTWPEGAVTIEQRGGHWWARTHRTGRDILLK